ncbi:MAG TPA: protein kinase [Candidatus Eisenbacteria bacterium]
MADPISRMASAVSDGVPVDWVKEKSARPEHLEALEQLSVVDRIRKVHESGDSASASRAEEDAETKTIRALEEAAKDAPTPLFQWGPLQVLEKVGEGGGGEVYRAIDPTLNAEVALKLLRLDYADSGQLARRFLDEARQLARVRHHNVLTVHGADQHNGRVGMWTEFVHGKPLELYLAEHGPLSACEAAVIGLDLCRALAAVHAAGLVHRDVKTTNVMREDGGRIVLMDFGSVAEVPEGGVPAWTAGVQGTPITMPPEQLRGKIAGPATDIYGLGVLLYRLVTRRYPVEAASLEELEEKHRHGAPTPLRDRRADLPLEFVRVVEQALQSDPAQRFQSTGAMEQALAATLGAIAQQGRIRRRHQGAVVAVLVGAAVVAGVLVGREVMPPAPVTPSGERSMNAAAAIAPAPLTAEVSLVRRVGDREEPIAAGAHVEPGDRLSMFIRGSDSMFVYILNEDAMGEVVGLYPIPGLVPTNPLEGHSRHRLPGDLGSEVFYWTVTSVGEREAIIAIGSRGPIVGLEEAIAQFPVATPGKPVIFKKVDPMALRSLRGIGGGSAMAPPEGEARRRLEAALEGLQARAKEKGDVWVWTIELKNPAPAR